MYNKISSGFSIRLPKWKEVPNVPESAQYGINLMVNDLCMYAQEWARWARMGLTKPLRT